MSRFILALGAAALMAVPAQAWQDGDAPEEVIEGEPEIAPEGGWDITAPPGMETREITLDVTEGTWMSLDVSPDGSMIAFDLLGDIYTMPISGGAATNIASGLAWDIQPRFSPDGSQIAFTSDRAGGDNIWVMNTDGSEPRQISRENFRLMNNPTWSPDGRYIAGRKHFTTSRSAGTGEIWMWHVLGGNGVQLVERPSEAFQKEQGEPIFDPAGGGIYYTRAISTGSTFTYADDSNGDLFNIFRYDLESGETETIVDGAGGAVRAAPSPDGRHMAFVRRERINDVLTTGLYVKDLNSGATRRLHDLDRDNQETWGVMGMYPNMDWTPDSESIVFWAGGGVHRIDVESGQAEAIPFRVQDTRDIIDPIRPAVEVAPETFQTRMPRQAAVSPDGEQVVFESLGSLYIMDLPGGTPRRLTRDDERREIFPAWSRDGRSIVFASWTDDALGVIRTISPSGRNERRITTEPGLYRRPSFSPDGETIVFEKDGGGFLTSTEWSDRTGIFVIDADGGVMRQVADNGANPHFGAENDRIFLTRAAPGAQLISVNLDGLDERIHANGRLIGEFHVAPDGEHLAFRENYDAYVMPMPMGPQNVGAGMSASALPVVEVSGNGATDIHWTNGGERINWVMGPTLFGADLAEFRPAPGADEFTPPEEGVSLSLTVETDAPEGVTALVGARIITMSSEDGGVIEDGVVIINDNRIVSVGSRAEVDIPSGARIADMSGHVITPGFIDAHAHGAQGTDGLIPQQNWSTQAHLALGVTTVFDPSSQARHIFAAGEFQRAGRILQPRTYSTGEIVYGAQARGFYAQIDAADDAREHVYRLAAQGAHGIKNYNQPRREQRQQVVLASQESGIISVAEGGSNYHMDMSMVADGNTSIEHNLPVEHIYEDVLQMFEQSEVALTPTLVVTYGGLAADPYWRQATDVWLHPILSQHVPPHILRPGSVRRTTAPESDFVDANAAMSSRRLAERGVYVSIGAHGQQQGLAAHWEIWSFARGGMDEVAALATATIVPARHLGLDADLGSIEAGKLADLVVMRSDPLADIRNTDDIAYVMLNGRLYEADTLNETVTGNSRRAPYYWE